jgi:hypothetical protein
MKRFTTSLVFRAVVFTVLSVGCVSNNGSSKDKADAGADGGGQDSGVELCTGDTACSDGKFCNGVERCNPGAKGADERGCVAPPKWPCDDGESCEESSKIVSLVAKTPMWMAITTTLSTAAATTATTTTPTAIREMLQG